MQANVLVKCLAFTKGSAITLITLEWLGWQGEVSRAGSLCPQVSPPESES